jgi:hypothetical protein
MNSSDNQVYIFKMFIFSKHMIFYFLYKFKAQQLPTTTRF